MSLMFFEVAMSVCAIWIFFDLIKDNDIFYALLIYGLMLGAIFISLQTFRYNNIMKMNIQSM